MALHRIVLSFLLIAILSASLVLVSCGNGDSDSGSSRSGDGDDDDNVPPVFTPDDDDDDDDDDDEGLFVSIISPTDGVEISGSSVSVIIETRDTVPQGTTITLIGNGNDPEEELDITSYFTVTQNPMTNVLTNMLSGSYTLSVQVSDDVGARESDSAIFTVNAEAPFIQIINPPSGALYFRRDVEFSATYTQDILPDSLAVSVDGDDITGDMSIGGGQISGVISDLAEGFHSLRVFGIRDSETREEGEVEAYSYFSVEIVPGHVEIELDQDTVLSGESVHVEYRVIDENGDDRTEEADMDWNVAPGDGVVLDTVSQDITFTRPGNFEIVLFTVVDTQFLTGNAWVWVGTRDAGSVVVELSTFTVRAGDPPVFATATVYDEEGIEIYGNVLFTAWPSYGVDITQGDPAFITATRSGQVVIRGTVEGTGTFGEATLTVLPGDPAFMELRLSEPVIAEGEFTHPYAVITDEYGNVVDEIGFALTVFPGAPGVEYVLDTPAPGDITFNTEGLYIISAVADAPYSGVFASRELHVIDLTSPDIELYTPERGQWVTDDEVFISGIVHDCDPATDLILFTGETQARYLDLDCTFEHTYHMEDGLNIVDILVTEVGGNSSRAAFSRLKGPKNPNGELIGQGLRFRINESGFQQFNQIIQPVLEDFLDQIPEMIYAMNPLFDEELSFWGVEVASARADATNVSLGEPWFGLDSVQDVGITMNAGVADIDLEFRVRGRILGIGYSISGSMGYDSVSLTAKTDIYADENGIFTVSVYDVIMSTSGFYFDISNFPDELEELFFSAIEGLMEDMIEDVLLSVIPSLLEDLLDQIPTSFGFQIGDVPFSVIYELGDILWDDTGGSFYMNVGISTPQVSPLIVEHGGSLKTPGAAPSHSEVGQFIPGTSNPYGFGTLLADDFLNQALSELYRGGLVSQDFNAIFDTQNAFIQLAFPGLHEAYPGDINIRLRPLLPPIFVLAPQDGGQDGPIPAELQIGDMIVDFFVNGAEGEKLFLEMAASLIMPAEVEVSFPENTLVFNFGDPRISFSVLAKPMIDWDNNLFENVAPILLDLFIPILDGLIGQIPLPTFSGYGLTVLDEMIMGSSNDFIGIFADLCVDCGD